MVRKDEIKICEIFKSIQGEGRYQGTSALFVRVSGCTRKCKWCDTKYHSKGKKWNIEDLAATITSKLVPVVTTTVVYSGGEPTLYTSQIKKVNSIVKTCLPNVYFHIESNGDLIKSSKHVQDLVTNFHYICISPKDVKTAKRISKLFKNCSSKQYDIKVVTDLDTVGVDLLPYATMLQPLTTYDRDKDLKIKQKVWEYCVNHGLFYSGRLHVEVWGNKKGV